MHGLRSEPADNCGVTTLTALMICHLLSWVIFATLTISAITTVSGFEAVISCLPGRFVATVFHQVVSHTQLKKLAAKSLCAAWLLKGE